MKSAHYLPRPLIIKDLPNPVKNACDALPSAVLSDNAVETAEIETRRVLAEVNDWRFVGLSRLKNNHEDDDAYEGKPHQTSYSSSFSAFFPVESKRVAHVKVGL